MKPCVVCGKKIKKRDSLMASVYVCSEDCRKKRKASLPKKLSVTSWQYWVNQGLSENDAKAFVSKMQAERSPRSTSYWIKNGFDYTSAVQKVFEYQQKNGLKNLEKYSKQERQERTPFSEKYWLKKGYTTEEASEILSKNADGTSLEYYINKYGSQQGQQLHSELCERRKQDYTLAGYQKKHGQTKGMQLWSKKYKNRHNSKKACNFFDKLSKEIGDRYKIYTAGNENGEYGVLNTKSNEYFFYDFVIPAVKLCVEYHGDYWHCNPKKYNALYKHRQSGATAEDIWKKDEIKLNTIISERAFDVVTVWESDDLQEKIIYIMEKINEFEKSKN
jgi:hypothetical protein